MSKWKLPIGDWSQDGHGKYDVYIIESNYNVEQAREAYIHATEEAGVDIGKVIADEYENSAITEESRIPKDLLEVFVQEGYIYRDEDAECYEVSGIDEMANLILRFIQYYNPDFEFEIILDNLDTLQGRCDRKGKHIGDFGYGLYYM